MAVHTSISLAEAQALGRCWGLEIEHIEGIVEGTLNSSHAIDVRGGRAFLRILERVDHRAAEQEAHLLAHLARSGVPTPAPIARVDRASSYAAEHAGKPALAITWVDGATVRARMITPTHVREVGAALAKLHHVGPGPEPVPEPKFTLARLASRLASRSHDQLHRGLLTESIAQLRARLDALAAAAPLPVRGLIHGDLFRENVLWRGSTLAAIVDFDAACSGNFAFDLMIAAHAWCFTDHFEAARLRALVDGYQSVRPLERDELEELYPAAMVAAVRFAVTRLLDYELEPGTSDGGHDYRRFLARARAIEALGPEGWRSGLGF